MNPWTIDTKTTASSTQESDKPSLHSLLSSARQSTPLQSTGKRVVYPAVPFMTVKEERKCLSEIRSYGDNIPDQFVLSNGMKAEEFALMYVLGHQLKRKEKQQSAGSSIDTTNILNTASISSVAKSLFDYAASESNVESDSECDSDSEIIPTTHVR